MNPHHDDELLHSVFTGLTALVDGLVSQGHSRDHVSAALRYAMAPMPQSDEVLQQTVIAHFELSARTAADEGTPLDDAWADAVMDEILDHAAARGVAPSRVQRIVRQHVQP